MDQQQQSARLEHLFFSCSCHLSQAFCLALSHVAGSGCSVDGFSALHVHSFYFSKVPLELLECTTNHRFKCREPNVEIHWNDLKQRKKKGDPCWGLDLCMTYLSIGVIWYMIVRQAFFRSTRQTSNAWNSQFQFVSKTNQEAKHGTIFATFWLLGFWGHAASLVGIAALKKYVKVKWSFRCRSVRLAENMVSYGINHGYHSS